MGGVCAADAAQNHAPRTRLVLGFPVLVGNHSEVLNELVDKLEQRVQTHVVTLNPEMVMEAVRNPEISDLLNSADIFVADGVGIEWAAKRAGADNVHRFAGVDLAYRLMEYLGEAKCSVFLLGAKPGIAKKAAERLTEKLPGLKISGQHDGYFSREAEVIKEISATKPDVLLVGMGSPKQESFISRNRAELGVPIMIGVGGSLEVFSGQKQRAPKFLQRCGLEWAYRSIIDISRLKRLGFLPKFMWLVLRGKGRGQA